LPKLALEKSHPEAGNTGREAKMGSCCSTPSSHDEKRRLSQLSPLHGEGTPPLPPAEPAAVAVAQQQADAEQVDAGDAGGSDAVAAAAAAAAASSGAAAAAAGGSAQNLLDTSGDSEQRGGGGCAVVSLWSSAARAAREDAKRQADHEERRQMMLQLNSLIPGQTYIARKATAPPPRSPPTDTLVVDVAARKATAPPEVRTVLCGGLSSPVYGTEVHFRVERVVAEWLVGAHAAAHADPATKRLARLVLGEQNFTTCMDACGVWHEPYKAGLLAVLQKLGEPLGEAFVGQNLRAVLGDLKLPLHTLVATDQRLCEVEGRAHTLRSDIGGIVQLPAAWSFDADTDPGLRQHQERVFMHMLVMVAAALNEQFHEMMREVLGPHVVDGEGVMAMSKGRREYRLTPPKGVARMECKRITDHVRAPGCRPALNIDVLRVIGVCETPGKLETALEALGARFGGCGRVKNGFAIEDAAYMFNLRTLMVNMVVDFLCTFGELAARPGVTEKWLAHVDRSEPAGGAPRSRWRAEAAEALAILTSAEFSDKPVFFVCEAQMLLNDVYQVRKNMHEPYKGFRADTCALLHADMVAETRKVENAERFAADGDAPLKKACRDGDADAAARLLAASSPSERDAAFVVACAHGRGDIASVPELRASAGRAWGAAWERAADELAVDEMGVDVVEALLSGAPDLVDGVDYRTDAAEPTALLRAARGGHTLAMDRLLNAGAMPDLTMKSSATPLLLAATKGHGGAVARLLRAGAAPDLGDRVKATPLMRAAEKGHDAVVALLLRAGAAPDLVRNQGRMTPLWKAAELGHEAVAVRLLSAGAAVDIADDHGATPLFIAAQNGHEAVVALLLEAGAAVDQATAKDQSDETEADAPPLLMAVQNGHVGVARLLLTADANADRVSVSGSTPRSAVAAGGAMQALFDEAR
jgi:ankyrin repeat protein